MKGLRPLLRLDDKVAAEGRRLQSLGAHPSRWSGLTLLVVAAILHGLMLTLPVLRVKATLPAPSPAPDFPRVWRFDPPPPAPPGTSTKAVSPAPSIARDRGEFVPAPAPPEATHPASARGFNLSLEPVAEPSPDLSMRLIAAEVQPYIPYPDAPPPPMEPGRASGAPAPPEEGMLRVISRTAPAYPVVARSASAEGRVTLRATVLPDGRVSHATVLDCSRPGVGFEAAAIQAIKRWRYEPAPPDSPVRSTTVTIDFKSQDRR